MSNFEYNSFKEDCPKYSFIPTIIEKKRRIVAIGDLHGDLDLTIRTLILSKVVDKRLNWIGKDTVVVQVGDKVDGHRPLDIKTPYDDLSGDDDIQILNLFYELNIKAEKVGGAVYSLLGNHELMNVLGDLRYVSKKSLLNYAEYNDTSIIFKEEFAKLSPIDRGIVARKYAFKPGNKYASFLGCANTGCIIIGSFLFAHAGIVPEFMNNFKITCKEDIVKFNMLIRKWLLNKTDINVKNIINDKNSPFWSRILGSIPDNTNITDSSCLPVSKVLNTINIGHMVIGHSPQFSGISGTCYKNGTASLFKIDIGASKAFKKFENTLTTKRPNISSAQVLEIINDGEEINILKE